MLSELKKSINSTLYERAASPLYGAFIVSWAIWNWKIIYLTLFVSDKKIANTKIEYISNNYADINFIIIYPVISTILLLTIAPFVSNGTYWLSLKFHKWRMDKKHQIEMSQLLTVGQSARLRTELAEKERGVERFLSGKDSEIKQLKLKLAKLRDAQRNIEDLTLPKERKSEQEIQDQLKVRRKTMDLVKKIINNNDLNDSLDQIASRIYLGNNLSDSNSTHNLSFFESNKLIQNKGNGVFETTDLWEDIYKKILEARLDKSSVNYSNE